MKSRRRYVLLILALVGWCGISAYVPASTVKLGELFYIWGSPLPLPTQWFYNAGSWILVLSAIAILALLSKEFLVRRERRLVWDLLGIVSSLVIFSLYSWSMMLPVHAHSDFAVGRRDGKIICKKHNEITTCGDKEQMVSVEGEVIKPQQ